MQKEIIIIIIVIIFIFTIDVVGQNYTKDNIKLISDKLDEISKISLELAEQELEEKNQKTEELTNKINELNQEWKQINNKMSIYIEHDELEKVNSSLVKLKSYFFLEEYKDGITEIENCKYILEHIKDKGSMKIINLF